MELKRIKGKNKIDLKYKIILLIIFIIIDVFLIFSFIKIKNAVSINQLNNRFNELLEINFTSDDYDNKTTTGGKYKIVEKAMNSYFIEYSDKTKELLDIINSDRLKSLLSVDNYEKEEHQFNDSISYIDSTKEDLNTRFNELYSYSNEENIEKYIKDISNDPKVIELFNNYMLSIEAYNYFDDCNSLLKAKQNEVNNILDISKEVLVFLKANDGKWIIKDNQIQFANTSLKQQYDDYISKVK